MAIVSRKPRNSSLRFQQYIVDSSLSKDGPEKSLVTSLKRKGGRNSYGRITVRHRGGGSKRNYRIIDFKRVQKDVVGIVKSFEYDPNRNVSIALIYYKNGAKGYILRPNELSVGDEIISSEKADIRVGNSLPLSGIPIGFFVHNVELRPGQGGKFARSAGSSIQIVGKGDNKVTLKMPSGEKRLVGSNCWATIGVLSNSDFRNLVLGKAGRNRHRGKRPSVRGMAMNPVDHPHGGGEGRSKSGSHPVTPWGKCCKGKRTRVRKSSLIINRRKK
jgi:large subunit ribosomal protein L2